MAPRRRRPTQADVARLAGVSQATVSLVISGGPASDQVAEATKEAVRAAAAELGYTANLAARSLRGGRNHLLGLYTFEPVFPIDQRDFYFPFLLGVEEETAERGYDLLLFSSAGVGGDRRIYVGGANRLKVADGCVLLGRHLHRDDLAHLVHEDFPFVFIGRREVPGEQLSYVAADYATATRDIVTRLAELGHCSMVYLQVTNGAEPSRDREEGLRAALASTGAHAVVVQVDPQDVTAERLAGWHANDAATAIIVEPTEDDELLAAVDRAATAAGLSIPGDISVALLGDPPLTNAPHRDWSRFSLRRAHMGREAVRLLLDLLDADDDEPRQLFVRCDQIPGETIAPPPQQDGA